MGTLRNSAERRERRKHEDTLCISSFYRFPGSSRARECYKKPKNFPCINHHHNDHSVHKLQLLQGFKFSWTLRLHSWRQKEESPARRVNQLSSSRRLDKGHSYSGRQRRQ